MIIVSECWCHVPNGCARLVGEKEWFNVGEVKIGCGRSDYVHDNRCQTLKKLIQELNLGRNVGHGLQHAAEKMSVEMLVELR